MPMSEISRNYRRSLLFSDEHLFYGEDHPVWWSYFTNFALDGEPDVRNQLDGKTRCMAILTVLIGCREEKIFPAFLSAAFNFEMKPVEMEEILYQAAAYLGREQVAPFFALTNQVLEQKGFPFLSKLRIEQKDDQKWMEETQAWLAEKENQTQNVWRIGLEENERIRCWLTKVCFGSGNRRERFSLSQRELLAFCFLASQGRNEKRLIYHAASNIYLGNSKNLLMKMVFLCLPYIGAQEDLHILWCIGKAAQQTEKYLWIRQERKRLQQHFWRRWRMREIQRRNAIRE